MAAPAPDFRVGDEVKTNTNQSGRISGTVIRAATGWLYYLVRFPDGRERPYPKDSLELVERAAAPAPAAPAAPAAAQSSEPYQFDLPPDQRYGHTGTHIIYEYDIGDKVTIEDYWENNNEPIPRNSGRVCTIVGRFHEDDVTAMYQVQFGKDVYLVGEDEITLNSSGASRSDFGNRFCVNTWYGTSASAGEDQTTSVWIYVYKRTETRVWYVGVSDRARNGGVRRNVHFIGDTKRTAAVVDPTRWTEDEEIEVDNQKIVAHHWVIGRPGPLFDNARFPGSPKNTQLFGIVSLLAKQRAEELATGAAKALYEHLMPPDPDELLQQIIPHFDRSWRDTRNKTLTQAWDEARRKAGLDPERGSSSSSSSAAGNPETGRTRIRRPESRAVPLAARAPERTALQTMMADSDSDDSDDDSAAAFTGADVDANGEPIVWKYDVGQEVKYKHIPQVGETRARRSRARYFTGTIAQRAVRSSTKSYGFQTDSRLEWVVESNILGRVSTGRGVAFNRFGDDTDDSDDSGDSDSGDDSSDWSREDEGAARGSPRRRMRELVALTGIKLRF